MTRIVEFAFGALLVVVCAVTVALCVYAVVETYRPMTWERCAERCAPASVALVHAESAGECVCKEGASHAR